MRRRPYYRDIRGRARKRLKGGYSLARTSGGYWSWSARLRGSLCRCDQAFRKERTRALPKHALAGVGGVEMLSDNSRPAGSKKYHDAQRTECGGDHTAGIRVGARKRPRHVSRWRAMIYRRHRAFCTAKMRRAQYYVLGAERGVVDHRQLRNIDPAVDNQLPRFVHVVVGDIDRRPVIGPRAENARQRNA